MICTASRNNLECTLPHGHRGDHLSLQGGWWHPYLNDKQALDYIQSILDKSVWDSGTIEEVADLVRETGRVIDEPEADSNMGTSGYES